MSKVTINNDATRVVGLFPGPTGPTGPAGSAGATGPAGPGLPTGGTTGQVPTKQSATDYDVAWESVVSSVSELVAGGAGFVNAVGAVSLNLSTGRHFHSTMTGEITSLAFTNVPTATEYSASWTWVLRIDATGGYAFANAPAAPDVVFVDGRSFDDADFTANAENVFSFWQIGSKIYGALITNGVLAFDPYVLSFSTNGSQLIPITRTETLLLGNVTNLEADGTAGTGTLSYKKNGIAASGSVEFVAGNVLEVTMASSTTPSAVGIPRIA